MISARAASSNALQRAISGSVRKHPRHRPLSPSTTHTFTQGVWMAAGGADISRSYVKRSSLKSMRRNNLPNIASFHYNIKFKKYTVILRRINIDK
jgi:hypothetical protein